VAPSPKRGNSNLTITAVNDGAVVVNDAYSTSEDTPATVAAPGVVGQRHGTSTGTRLTAVLVRAPARRPDAERRRKLHLHAGGETSMGSGGLSPMRRATVGPRSNVATVTADDHCRERPAPVVVKRRVQHEPRNTPLTVAAPGAGQRHRRDGDALTAVLVDGPGSTAQLTLNADGSFQIKPATDFKRQDSSPTRRANGQAD